MFMKIVKPRLNFVLLWKPILKGISRFLMKYYLVPFKIFSCTENARPFRTVEIITLERSYMSKSMLSLAAS